MQHPGLKHVVIREVGFRGRVWRCGYRFSTEWIVEKGVAVYMCSEVGGLFVAGSLL